MDSDEILKSGIKVLAENNGIIYIEINKLVSDVASNIRQAELINEQLLALLAAQPAKKFPVLVNLMPLGAQANFPSPQARRIFASMMDYGQVGKIAVLVSNSLLRSIINFVSYLARKKDLELFEDKEKALAWLREK